MKTVLYEEIKDQLPAILAAIPVAKKGKGRTRKGRKGVYYLDAVCAFDIETSRTAVHGEQQAFMYLWQFQLDKYFCIYGRYWSEYRDLCDLIEQHCKAKMVVFVHNLSHEFQFLKAHFEFDPEKVFALDKRKILRAECDMVEYRCSYLLTNMSLDAYTHKMGVKNAKVHGFDYDKVRYPWTQLSDFELDYATSDVIGLVQALKMQMKLDGDNLYTLPMTSTGYVRRDVKQAVKLWLPHAWLRPLLPDWHIYELEREAFRGGNTHANRYMAGDILPGVVSYDRSSSYPDVQVNDKFPISAFYQSKDPTYDDLQRLTKIRGRAALMRVSFSGIRLKYQYWGCPYIPVSKCRSLRGSVNDNGRVLSASYLEITLTDIDFDIIESEYQWDKLEFTELWSARYGKLPKCITDITLDYYRRKTALKGVPDQDYYYMKSKNLLNSIYGMSAENPVKVPLLYDPGGKEIHYDLDADLQEILKRSNALAFQSYAWGVWVTAWARLRLEEGIRIAGDAFVYADTDSVKYIDTGQNWEQYNQIRQAASTKSGAWADDPKGRRHYMGVYEFDGAYTRFKTLGAKKYCYEDQDGLHLTVAGVAKKTGAIELKRRGGIEAFQEGLTFVKAGGLEARYHDNISMEVAREGHRLHISDNVALCPSTYTLGITGEYMRILLDAEKYKKGLSILRQNGII